MTLDPLQEQIVRVAQSLPEAQSLALAGGGAMLALFLLNVRSGGAAAVTALPQEPEE